MLLQNAGTKLLGVDAFNLLFEKAPVGITGGLEGATLGVALALGARLGGDPDAAPRWRPVLGAGIAGAIVGGLIPSPMVASWGNLEQLARSLDGSRLQLDALGPLFGEIRFGSTSQVILSGIEGLLFASCVAAALVWRASRCPQSPPSTA